MRIAQVAPLYESVPPKLYGGTERIVAYLTEALIDLGHEVVLYASGDSQTRAELRQVCSEALRLNPHCKEPIAPHIALLEKVFQESGEFDVIHFHNEFLHLPLARRLKTPHLTTMHGRQDLSDYRALQNEFTEIPLVSISNNQRNPAAQLNWRATIYHGMPTDRIPYSPVAADYVAFLGRISPDKGVEQAIGIARKSGLKLKIAAKIDKGDLEYLETIQHLFKEPFVEFIGEINDRQKSSFLGGAQALLFPITWPEPFGLVMIEALAAGTPVIAYPQGSVPEIVRHNHNGFIVSNVDDGARAIKNLGQIKRSDCRLDFEKRFSAERMARDYVNLYRRLARENLAILPFSAPYRSTQTTINSMLYDGGSD